MTLHSNNHTIIVVCNTPTVSYITPTSVVCTIYFYSVLLFSNTVLHN